MTHGLPDVSALAIERPGFGAVYGILEMITRAHSVHTEIAPHGFFLKAHFAKTRREKADSPASAATTCEEPSVEFCVRDSTPKHVKIQDALSSFAFAAWWR